MGKGRILFVNQEIMPFVPETENSYISRYLSEVEQLLMNGIKKNYTLIEENQKFLKGKLHISKQIVKNCTDKTHFAVRYSKYIENIPQNRLIVSTLYSSF